MSDARRHHYVPQFYLRAFVGPDGQLWQYKREPSGKVSERRVSPRATGFAPDLYTVREVAPWLPERKPVAIETELLAKIDLEAAPVQRKLIGEALPALSDEERTAWALFLNSMLERSARLIGEREVLAPKLAGDVLARLRQRPRTPDALKRLDETLGSFDLLATTHNSIREHMARSIQNSAMVDAIKSAAWVVLHLDPATHLITGDAPLVIDAGEQLDRIGIMSLALSPHRLFILHPRSWPSDSERQELFELLVASHNLLLFAEAPRFLYARERITDDERGSLRTTVEHELGRSMRQ